MPTLAFSQAPLTCSSALRLRTTATRHSARPPTFRNSAHTNSEAIGHRTQSNTEITSLHCERSNKTEWHLSPRGDLGILYYFIIHAISCSLLRISDQRPRISKRPLEIHINSKNWRSRIYLKTQFERTAPRSHWSVGATSCAPLRCDHTALLQRLAEPPIT